MPRASKYGRGDRELISDTLFLPLQPSSPSYRSVGVTPINPKVPVLANATILSRGPIDNLKDKFVVFNGEDINNLLTRCFFSAVFL